MTLQARGSRGLVRNGERGVRRFCAGFCAKWVHPPPAGLNTPQLRLGTFSADRFSAGRFSWTVLSGAANIRFVRLTEGETNFFRPNSLRLSQLGKFVSTCIGPPPARPRNELLGAVLREHCLTGRLAAAEHNQGRARILAWRCLIRGHPRSSLANSSLIHSRNQPALADSVPYTSCRAPTVGAVFRGFQIGMGLSGRKNGSRSLNARVLPS